MSTRTVMTWLSLLAAVVLGYMAYDEPQGMPQALFAIACICNAFAAWGWSRGK